MINLTSGETNMTMTVVFDRLGEHAHVDVFTHDPVIEVPAKHPIAQQLQRSESLAYAVRDYAASVLGITDPDVSVEAHVSLDDGVGGVFVDGEPVGKFVIC